MVRTPISAVSISQALKGIDFPARVNELVRQAQNNNASEEVIQAIRNLQDQEFQNMAEVEQAFGEEKRAAS